MSSLEEYVRKQPGQTDFFNRIGREPPLLFRTEFGHMGGCLSPLYANGEAVESPFLMG
jgi:hypothetical protein